LTPRFLSDPDPQKDKSVSPWVRLDIFSIKTPPLNVGFYASDLYEGKIVFAKTWEPALYGTIATTKNELQVAGYRGAALNDSARESIGVSVSLAASVLYLARSMPYVDDLSIVNQYGAKYGLFTIGQYSGLPAITVLLCLNPESGQTAGCIEYSPE
jgi:hypothetical protein